MKMIVAFNYIRKTLHRRYLTGFWICRRFWIYQRSEYTGFLNIPGFWIYQGGEYARVLNMSGFCIYHGSKYARFTQDSKSVWITPGYAWLCLNVPKSVSWLLFYIYLLWCQLIPGACFCYKRKAKKIKIALETRLIVILYLKRGHRFKKIMTSGPFCRGK